MAVKTVLEIGDEEIRGAKSGFYPNIDVVAGIKRAGDTPRLNLATVLPIRIRVTPPYRPL